MLVETCMKKNPETVMPDDYLTTARVKVKLGKFHRLPVIKEGKLVGIVTDRDLRENREFLKGAKVSEVMTKDFMTVTPRGTVETRRS